MKRTLLLPSLILVTLVLTVPAAFAQCPAAGNDTGCGTVITITNTGVIVSTTGQGPYDGDDDTLVGVVNRSSQPIRSLGLVSTLDILALDGDGVDTFGITGNPQDSTGYGGPNAYFTNINADGTAGTVNFITPIAANGGTGYFSLENVLSSAYNCQQIINNGLTGPITSGTGVTASFSPNLGLTLTEAAAYCGFADFDWQQTITSWPAPSPLFQVGNATPLSTPPSFFDPPSGGYTYELTQGYPGGDKSYPFYYDPTSGELATHQTSYTLSFADAPSDPCLPGGNGSGCAGKTAAAGSFLGFSTHLAGVTAARTAIDLGIGFTWKSTFNGTSGGTVATKNNKNVDPGSGTGGVTITSVQQTSAYQYGGVVVQTVNGVAVATIVGLIDTPVNNATNLAGAVAVTGWAVGLNGIASVGVWREPITGETPQANGLVFLANATFVPGARPDVAASYPNYPNNTTAGWGVQVLTNQLPGTGGNPLGNGSYKLHAIAKDFQGGTKDLGTVAISVNNTASIIPFGTIDTPAQGETVSGKAYVNFGWALTPKPANSIPANGSTVNIFIDSPCLSVIPTCNTSAVHPTAYNVSRCDIGSLFPGLANSGSADCAKNGTSPGPVGYYLLDTTKLANGLHSISWTVTDTAGNAQGIGSRFFLVQN